MKSNKKFYPSTQLIMLLHPKVLKVYMYLIGWRNSKVVKIYPNQIVKALKLTEKDVAIAVQSLIDNNLIQLKDDYEVIFNIEEANKYFNIQIKEAEKMELLPVSTEITWNKKQTSSTDSLEDMSENQIKLLLLRLQATLEERKQVKELVKSSTETKDLPF